MKAFFVIASILSIILLIATIGFGIFLERKGSEHKNRAKYVKFHTITAGLASKLALASLIIGLILAKNIS